MYNEITDFIQSIYCNEINLPATANIMTTKFGLHKIISMPLLDN